MTPATAEIEKWLRIRVRFFLNFSLRDRIRVRKKNAESYQWRLRYSGSGLNYDCLDHQYCQMVDDSGTPDPVSTMIVLTTSIARWLWPKSAKWCHKKLLDSAEALSQIYS